MYAKTGARLDELAADGVLSVTCDVVADVVVTRSISRSPTDKHKIQFVGIILFRSF